MNEEKIMTNRHLNIYDNITEVIGHTPIVRLKRLFPHHNVLAKLEGFNPIGSTKDRVALHIIKTAIKQLSITSDTTVIESSSGNFALGLATVCKLNDIKFIAVVDPNISQTNLRILKLRGAEIEMVLKPDATGNYLSMRIKRVHELLKEIPNGFWTCQYDSFENPNAHYFSTGSEIVDQLDGHPLDYFMTATSTTGTISGVSVRLKETYPDLKIIAVDEAGSSLFDGQPGPRLLNGMGAGYPLPELAVKTHQEKIVDRIIRVNAKEAIQGCYDLLDSEGIMAGFSGGAVIAALNKLLTSIPSGSSVLVILADRGERYLDSVYDEEWVAKKLYRPQLTVAA
jgi:N-(2-amino-2-carboxyethyl)-L-glutamate synthase